jgi:hypothetical protein
LTNDPKQEHRGHYSFRDETRNQRIVTRRVIAKTIGGEAFGDVKAWTAVGDYVENARTDDGANYLYNNIRDDVRSRKATTRRKAEHDGRIQMTAENVTDAIGHCHDGQTEGKSKPICSMRSRAVSSKFTINPSST